MDAILPYLIGILAILGVVVLVDTIVFYRKASARGRLLDEIAEQNARKFLKR